MATLHASAVQTNAGAVLFLGKSGAGKSSLLAALIKRGYPMMADDVAGVVLDDAVPTVLPAFPCTRLWADALDHLAWWPRVGRRVREDMDKHLAPIDEFYAFPLALRACFVLTVGGSGDIELSTTAPSDAFLWLSKYAYRKKYLVGLGQAGNQFRTISTVVGRVPVYRARRPAHSFQLGSLAEQIDGPLQGQGACSAALQLTDAKGWREVAG